jgi:glycosyltransferase involved in cell wall biosynthesis
MNGVPPFALHSFAPRQCAYALVVGVYNEGEQFTRQLEALQPYRHLFDILIADGGSTDGATTATALGDKATALIINTSDQKGLSVQYRAALHYALKQEYTAVVMMDGNGKDGADALPRFAAALSEGYDFIQGSRFMPGGIHCNTPWLRLLGIRLLFTPLMRAATGFAYTDAINGFKACSRRYLTDPRLQPFRAVFVGYSLQYYLNYSAPRLHMRVTEVPVTRNYRKHVAVQSKIIGLRAWLKILRELMLTITGVYTPPK